MRKKPFKVFVASAREDLPVVRAVEYHLEQFATCDAWDLLQQKASQTVIHVLQPACRECPFGVFILSPRDRVRVRGKWLWKPRDNALLELGMWLGRHKVTNVFILVPRSKASTTLLPSDLDGLIVLEYDDRRPDRNWKAATATACADIRERIEPPLEQKRLSLKNLPKIKPS